MPSKGKADGTEAVLDIEQLQTESTMITLVGTKPLICSRMSEKAKGDLLLGGRRKTAAEKASVAKHDPYEEFLASPYTLRDEGDPAWIAILGSAFKGAMATAALDLPGARKTQIGRLVTVEENRVPIFGKPMLFMAVTRSADINHTPDIRTRAILPEWACQLTISYVTPLINSTSIVNLIAAAGITAGVGDWRPEKGKGSYGQFRIAAPDDEVFVRLREQWGRGAQQVAMEDPEPYDDETENLMQWYQVETRRRGLKAAS